MFTIEVRLANVSELGAFALALSANPQRMELEAIESGELLNTASRTFVRQSEVTAGAGRAHLLGYTLGRLGAGASGDGVLARVRVRALVSGAPALSLTDAMVTDPSSAHVPLEMQFDGARVYLPAVAR